jgi:lysophospholipase L1-like esterase
MVHARLWLVGISLALGSYALSASTSYAASLLELRVTVHNNFGLFRTEDSRRQHVRDFCRYLRCGSGLASDFNNAPPLCNDVIAAFAARNAGNACPADRIKEDDQHKKYWRPNTEALTTSWNSRDYTYDLKQEKTRQIEVEVHKAPAGASCSVRVTRVTNVILEQLGLPCDHLPLLYLEPADQPYKIDVKLTRDGETSNATAEILLKTVVVVALGDSISSGEGMPHRLHDNETTMPDLWLERRCHRSFFNFTSLALAVAAEQAPTTTFEYINLACSGSTITASAGQHHGGLLVPYEGTLSKQNVRDIVSKFEPALQDGNHSLNSLEPQVDQAKIELAKLGVIGKTPDYVIMSIGGNDILFGSLVFQAILRKDCRESWGEWLLSWARDMPKKCLFDVIKDERFKILDKELIALRDRVNALNPKRVLLVGYINPTVDATGQTCRDEDLGDRLLGPVDKAKFGYLVDSKEAERAYLDVLKPLNEKLTNFVKAQPVGSGKPEWRYINPDSIKKAGVRGWCAKPSWFVTYQDSQTKSRDEFGTAHPNIYGQNWLSWLIRSEFAKDKILDPALVSPPT